MHRYAAFNHLMTHVGVLLDGFGDFFFFLWGGWIAFRRHIGILQGFVSILACVAMSEQKAGELRVSMGGFPSTFYQPRAPFVMARSSYLCLKRSAGLPDVRSFSASVVPSLLVRKSDGEMSF